MTGDSLSATDLIDSDHAAMRAIAMHHAQGADTLERGWQWR